MNKISFVNFNPNGLEPLVKELKKNKLLVLDLVASNIPKREDGFQIKTATITFESGQKLAIKIKANGSIFQARLNGKVVPIKNSEDLHDAKNLKAAVKEMADFVLRNEVAYTKQKMKKLNAVPGTKPNKVSVSIAKQLAYQQAQLEDLSNETEELEARLVDSQHAVDSKRLSINNLKSTLAEEQRREAELQAEYDKLLAEAGA